MPDISTLPLLPPSSWSEFEDICSDLFCVTWADIHTDRYGRDGQRQNGVDIYGRPNKLHCGVQCKGKQIWPPKKLSISEINSEVAKALKFEPKLDELIFATTAPSDITATDRANEITKEHEEKGLFSVHVWSWNKISRELKKHNSLISKHYDYISNDEVKKDIQIIAKKLKRPLNQVRYQKILRMLK